MTSRLYAAIGVWLCVAFALAGPVVAKPHATDPRRVTLVPGFSLAFPSSWFGCGDLAKRLPHPPEAEHALSEMCKPIGGAKAHVVFLTQNEGVDLVVTVSDLPMSENAAKAMESEFRERLAKLVCEKISRGYGSRAKIENCTLRTKLAGGHHWILVSYVVAPANGRRKLTIREAMVQYGDKSLEVQFGFLAIATGKGDSMVDAMLDSVDIDNARAPSVPAAALIQLAPAQNVGLGVPRGWRGCRADVDALLGNSPNDPIPQRDDVCETMMTKGFLAKAEWTIVAAPQTFRSVWLGIAHNNGQTVTPRDIELVQADLGGETARSECARVATAYQEANASVEHCEAGVETVGGHPALAIRLILIAPQFPAKLAVRIYVVPYGSEQLAIIVMTPVFLEAETKPEIDRVLASLGMS